MWNQFLDYFKQQKDFKKQIFNIKQILIFAIFLQLISLPLLLVGLLIALSPSISDVSSISGLLFALFAIFVLISELCLGFLHYQLTKLDKFKEINNNTFFKTFSKIWNINYIGFIIMPFISFILICKKIDPKEKEAKKDI